MIICKNKNEKTQELNIFKKNARGLDKILDWLSSSSCPTETALKTRILLKIFCCKDVWPHETDSSIAKDFAITNQAVNKRIAYLRYLLGLPLTQSQKIALDASYKRQMEANSRNWFFSRHDTSKRFQRIVKNLNKNRKGKDK